jgi:hypothetical protein
MIRRMVHSTCSANVPCCGGGWRGSSFGLAVMDFFAVLAAALIVPHHVAQTVLP